MKQRDYVQDTYKAQTRPQFISVTTNPKGGDVLTVVRPSLAHFLPIL